MIALSEHTLLVFWTQLFVLVVVARGLGSLMRRIGQPAVVGELAAGLLLGPSVLGRAAPSAFEWIFPNSAVQSAAILAIAWLGVALLLVVTGFETDLKLLTSLGRSSFLVSTGSLLVPLAAGFAVGMLLPDALLGSDEMRVPFALFMAVALSISALPVVAKILMDMNLMRRNVGQVTVAAGMANDLVGWILLGTIAGLVAHGGFQLGGLALTVGLMALFLVVMLTGGQRVVDAALRRARPRGVVSSFTVVLTVTLGAGVVTQLIGVEAVLGAFVAGILLGRSRYQQPEVRHSLETVVHGFLAPVFFATAGLSVDLGTLGTPVTAGAAAAVLAVGALSKLAGSYAGARMGGMTRMEGLAVGVGLNARGAMEIVVATIGLNLGVLNATSYTVVVVLAMSTSMMAPPILRRILTGMEAGPEEAARLEREAVLEASIVAGTEVALLPTRGGANSLLAGRILDLSLQPDTAITVLTVHGSGDAHAIKEGERGARELVDMLANRRVDRIARTGDDPVRAITAEAALGYGLVALGVTEEFGEGRELSPVLRRVIANCPVPMLLVKHGEGFAFGRDERIEFRRLLVPAAGTKTARAAQEIGFTLAGRVGAAVDVVHVHTRQDQAGPEVEQRSAIRSRLFAIARPTASVPSEDGDRTMSEPLAASEAMLSNARTLAAKFGTHVNVLTRTAVSAGPELVSAADEQGADAIVIGAQVRGGSDTLFLGHGVEHIFEHASQTVIAVIFPQ